MTIAPHATTIISLDEDIGDEAWLRRRLQAAQIDPDKPHDKAGLTNGDLRVVQIKEWEWLEQQA